MARSTTGIGGHQGTSRGIRRVRFIAAPALGWRMRRGDVVPVGVDALQLTATVEVDHRPQPTGRFRRRRPPPTTMAGYLDQLPARVLLDRLPTPAVAVGLDGLIIYANPAYARLLGHAKATTLTGRPLNTLLAGRSHTLPTECVTLLQTTDTGAMTNWCHVDGYPVATLVSQPLLIRDDDPLLLITVTDMTECLWSNGSSIAG